MIRNIKNYGDDEKQLITLKEQLQLAIKNDEAISAMRANAQKNIPLELSREDQRTLAEQIADEDSQRIQAQEKLSQLFKGQEVLTILGLINKDQIIGINTLWNGIKDELKGVNTKLMLPKDFILFLNKYMDDAVSLQGALTVGLNSVEDMQKIIPNKDTIDELLRFLQTRSRTTTQVLQVQELGKVLPTDADYTIISRTPAIEQKNLIDEGNSLYPNRILLEKAIAEGNLGKIEKLLQVFTPANRDKIIDFLDKIKATPPPKPARPVARPAPRPRPLVRPSPTGKPVPKGQAIRLTQRTTGNFNLPIPKDKDDAKAVREFELDMTDLNKQFLDSLKPVDRTAIIKARADPSTPITKDQRNILGEFMLQNVRNIGRVLNKYPDGKDRDAVLEALRDFNPDVSIDTYEFVGKGIKMGRGRPPSDKPKVPYKIKIGEGIKVERKPVNIEFGKYILNTNQLKKQVLHLKGRAGGALSWFKPTPMSDQFTELITDMIASSTVNKHLLKSLDKEEQNLFYEVCDKAGLLGAFKLTKPENTEEKDQMNKFQILLGEFKAGSNSPLLFQQLRKYIIFFTEKGRIPKQKALSMLAELS
jgi:hypothetical protein